MFVAGELKKHLLDSGGWILSIAGTVNDRWLASTSSSILSPITTAPSYEASLHDEVIVMSHRQQAVHRAR